MLSVRIQHFSWLSHEWVSMAFSLFFLCLVIGSWNRASGLEVGQMGPRKPCWKAQLGQGRDLNVLTEKAQAIGQQLFFRMKEIWSMFMSRLLMFYNYIYTCSTNNIVINWIIFWIIVFGPLWDVISSWILKPDDHLPLHMPWLPRLGWENCWPTDRCPFAWWVSSPQPFSLESWSETGRLTAEAVAFSCDSGWYFLCFCIVQKPGWCREQWFFMIFCYARVGVL